MDPSARAEILRAYAAHARRFDRYARSRHRRGADTAGEAPPAGRGSSAVTKAELRVLELIAEGLTDKQIAEREGLSEFTVKSHVRSLFRKLRARNRPHAVATAVKCGLLSFEISCEAQSAAEPARRRRGA